MPADLPPAVIASNTTTVSNVSSTQRGFPVPADSGAGASRAIGTASTSPFARHDGRTALAARNDQPGSGVPVTDPTGPPVVTEGSGSNLDPWYWQMHGSGSGSIDPTGTHAFSGLLGPYPTAICWDAFHGTASPLIVIQDYQLKVWSPVVTLRIKAHWDRVFEHFSAAASGRFLFASVDVQAELNNMRINGDIEVELLVDTTLPGADEIARRLDEKSNLVYATFMEQARGIIFDPPQPQVEPAEASSSRGSILSPWGAGVSLNYRRDTTRLTLDYEETQQFAYLQNHTISSSLTGMYDEIKDDPDAERKYFYSVYLDDWPRKIAKVCRPVASWDDGAVEFLSVQCGYPSTTGAIQWEGTSFSDAPGEDGTWKYQTAQKAAADVADAPEDWEPDLTFVKRKVHLAEPPSPASDPYRRVQIERNVIDLDPEPSGTLMNDTTVEVRADSAGRLSVGPIGLGVVLTDNTQVVEAVFEAVDPDSGEPVGMEPVRFRWKQDDLDRDRTWTIFTGDPDFLPFFRYKVFVTVRGTLFEPGRSWEGPWKRGSGNGPLVVEVPRPEAGETRTIPDERVRALRAIPSALSGDALRSAPRSGEGATCDGARSTVQQARSTYLEYQL